VVWFFCGLWFGGDWCVCWCVVVWCGGWLGCGLGFFVEDGGESVVWCGWLVVVLWEDVEVSLLGCLLVCLVLLESLGECEVRGL
jgi:hypothetical protein